MLTITALLGVIGLFVKIAILGDLFGSDDAGQLDPYVQKILDDSRK